MEINKGLKKFALGIGVLAIATSASTTNKAKPNVLAIWGDDIGYKSIRTQAALKKIQQLSPNR